MVCCCSGVMGESDVVSETRFAADCNEMPSFSARPGVVSAKYRETRRAIPDVRQRQLWLETL